MYQFYKRMFYYHSFIHGNVFLVIFSLLPPTIGSPSKNLKQKWLCIYRSEKLILFIQQAEETSTSRSRSQKLTSFSQKPHQNGSGVRKAQIIKERKKLEDLHFTHSKLQSYSDQSDMVLTLQQIDTSMDQVMQSRIKFTCTCSIYPQQESFRNSMWEILLVTQIQEDVAESLLCTNRKLI